MDRPRLTLPQTQVDMAMPAPTELLIGWTMDQMIPVRCQKPGADTKGGCGSITVLNPSLAKTISSEVTTASAVALPESLQTTESRCDPCTRS